VAEQKFEIKFHGWGPCFHSDAECAQVQDWIDHLVTPRKNNGYGGQLEDLLWNINIECDGTVQFFCDMWVGVSVTGILFKTNEKSEIIDSERSWRYAIFVESDSFLAGLAGAYAYLKCKQAEINEDMLDDNYHPRKSG
jgi:hypothetical protein